MCVFGWIYYELGRLILGTANSTEEFFVRQSPLYEVRTLVNNPVTLRKCDPGRRTTCYVGHSCERYPSICFGATSSSACSLEQWDKWVDPTLHCMTLTWL